jgi:hypothetical protein
MKKRFSKVMLAVLFLSVLTLVIMITPLVKAQTMSLSPSSGPVGTTVTVRLSGFNTAGDTEIVDLAGTNFPSYELGPMNTGSTGSGTATFTIPASENPYYGVVYYVTPGAYTITASGTTYLSDSASATFTVTASTSATPTPTTTPSATPAPSVSATPTSTPKIPEFSNAALVLVLAAVAAATLCAVALSVKKQKRIC